VEEACNCKVLVPASFEHQPGDAEQVRYVRNGRPFAHLVSMRSNGEVQSIGEVASNHKKPRELFTELLCTPRLCCCIGVSSSPCLLREAGSRLQGDREETLPLGSRFPR
jgi:hypothetical protein